MKAIVQHLRFPFSYLLLPVFLFALISLEQNEAFSWNSLLLFIILHILVYPSSNAYNSLQDQDEGSIGLVKNPLPAEQSIKWVSLSFDLLAILLSLFISWQTALFIVIYILASRTYSYRKIRLKKYPILGFLVVFIFQGAWVYFLVQNALQESQYINSLNIIAASFLIGSIYPLSQIYQHKEDKADGVNTISMLLGKKGTFIFSGIMFLLGSFLLMLPYFNVGDYSLIWLYLVFQIPSLVYFNYWFFQVIKDEHQANFKNTMRMSLLSATCMIGYFLFVILS